MCFISSISGLLVQFLYVSHCFVALFSTAMFAAVFG